MLWSSRGTVRALKPGQDGSDRPAVLALGLIEATGCRATRSDYSAEAQSQALKLLDGARRRFGR